MTTKIKNKIDAIDTTIALLTEQLDLQDKVTKMLDTALPACGAPDNWLCTAMQFYRFDIEHILHDALLGYTYELEFNDRDRSVFFAHHVSCPLDIASDISDIVGGVN